MIKYAVVEHYPDGNSSAIAMFDTEQQARCYITINHYDLCTIEQMCTITISSEELKKGVSL